MFKKFLERVNPIDWTFIVYQIVVSCLLLIFYNRFDHSLVYLTGHLGALIGALLLVYLIGPNSHFILNIIRYWYPVFTYGFLFTESNLLNQMIFQGHWDDFFARIDLGMFNVDPNQWLYDRLDNFYVNEFLHFCYFSYYFLPTLLGVFLYIRRDKNYFNALFGMSITFYFCYLMFIWIPAYGPVHLRHGKFQDGWIFVAIMDWLYTNADVPGAAFPSSHVAVALITLLYAYRFQRNLFWPYLPLISGLIFSTVYCFYHYVIDVFAGIFVGLSLYFLTNYFFKRYFADSDFMTENSSEQKSSFQNIGT